MLKRILIALSIVIGTAAVLVLNWPGVLRPAPRQVVGETSVGGAFALTDANGATVTDAALKGHYSLLYFGFTQCPDVCPLSLQKITDALQMAGPAADSVLPVFITVDPVHDTPAVMKAYVANFHPRFLALTGTPEAIKQVEADYRVYTGTAGQGDAARIMHGDLIYLMDPDGKNVAQFPSDAEPAAIVSELRKQMSGK